MREHGEHRLPVKFSSKGWGFEKTVGDSKKYFGSYSFLIKDARFPMQFHKIQDKTLYIHSGKLKVFYTTDTQKLKQMLSSSGEYGVYSCMESTKLHKGDSFCIPPGCVYQIMALEDSEVYTFATAPVKGDCVEIIKGD